MCQTKEVKRVEREEETRRRPFGIDTKPALHPFGTALALQDVDRRDEEKKKERGRDVDTRRGRGVETSWKEDGAE